MAKTIIREIIIILLLCLAIILILGVVLYNYVPTNKLIPQEVSYKQTEEVKKAIEDSVTAQNSQVILTYEIDDTDLSNYQKDRDYKPGKVNPFSSYQKEQNGQNNTQSNTPQKTEENQTTENSNNNLANNNVNSTKSIENETNTNSLFPDRGTK